MGKPQQVPQTYSKVSVHFIVAGGPLSLHAHTELVADRLLVQEPLNGGEIVAKAGADREVQ